MTVRWLTAFVDRPSQDVADTVRFWCAVTASTLSPPRGERTQFATFVPADGDAYLRVQTVAEGNGGIHLDVHVTDVDASAQRAVELGARAQRRAGYVTLTSPAGLRWCLVPAEAAALKRPAPVARPQSSSLVDQVCIDIPADHYGAECVFWESVTGWELRAGSRPELAYLVRPADLPLRILLQRLDAPPPDGLASGHLDLATTNVGAEVELHESWGARVLARCPNWTTLADSTGRPYCITRRDPVTGALPG